MHTTVNGIISMQEAEMWDGFDRIDDAFEMEEVPEQAKACQVEAFEKRVQDQIQITSEEANSQLGSMHMEDVQWQWDEEEQDNLLSEVLLNIKIGVRKVPSLDALCQMQKRVHEQNGVPTIDWKSLKGNAFSFNDLRTIIAKDWNNPLSYQPMVLFSEVWHPQKWREDIDRHLLSPMYDGGYEHHFYIDEADDRGKVWADVWEIKKVQTKFCIVCNCGPGDNPAHSEASGHIGANGNFPCQKCYIVLYTAITAPGATHSAECTLLEVQNQICLACLRAVARAKEEQTKIGVKDAFSQHWIDNLMDRAHEAMKSNPLHPITEIQDELFKWVDKNKNFIYNPLLTMRGFDASKDTPVELLHSILLGVVKYSCYSAKTVFSVIAGNKFSIKLVPENCNENKKIQKWTSLPWLQTEAAKSLNAGNFTWNEAFLWFKGQNVITKSLDKCTVGSWVFSKLPHVEKVTQVVPSNHILFEFNTQHDCRTAGCKPTGKQHVIQEQKETAILEDLMEHKPLEWSTLH
ncbi:hypothetical protein BDQ12DRAFT_672071 [Crucibulum laeve]|uniref:Uncharacterized protein n=1 Tax=Crucibulum laeve TaxID=68775 RepID=A0A5C3LEB6_9AGAR|nr:hypothetical protein BDQ12DRAFT_672071 [Crucibulum laeve]